MMASFSRSDKAWPKYRWVVFDAVGTLIQPNPSVSVAYHAIAARHGSRLTVSQISERFRRAFRESESKRFLDDQPDCTRWQSNNAIEIARWRWIVNEVVTDVGDGERCFTELWDHFAHPASWSCFDDVKETLSALADAGYRMAIASNFDSRLHAVCDENSALRPIEHRFVSSETGFRKPAPEFYSAVISHCGSPAREILMVGDDPEHDVAGPKTAGMQAVLLDRRATNAHDNSIESLHQLVAGLRD